MNIMIIFVCFMMSKVNMFCRRELNIFFVLVINLLKMLINKYIIYNINFMLYIDVFVVYVVFMVEFIYIIYQFFIVFVNFLYYNNRVVFYNIVDVLYVLDKFVFGLFMVLFVIFWRFKILFLGVIGKVYNFGFCMIRYD